MRKELIFYSPVTTHL